MKKSLLPCIIFSLVFIVGCRTEDPTPISEAAAPTNIASKGSTPVSEAAAPTNIASKGSTPTALSTVLPSSKDSAKETESSSVSETLPQPTLIDTDWNNLDIFSNGLIESELGVLNELTGLSIYHIVLQIEDPTTISGQMEIRYRNQETEPLTDLFFQLFPNRLGGSISVSDVTINGLPVQPVQESTDLQVPLTAALSPGEEVVVTMNFTTTVPQEEGTKYNILAYDEDILTLAHFYPMIPAFDNDGWHIESTPPQGDETYADMSYYIVQVSAPAEQIIVGSGVEVERSETDGRQTVTLAAGPMRDFYLVMSDRFGLVTDQVGPIRINSYAPAEFLDGAALALDVTAQAIRSYSVRYGPYPYKELDIVSTPTSALGVEYPGIFANALRIYDLDQNSSSGTPNTIMLEGTTAHETGHQWFYNLVGNDQINEPWLDEALTQYAAWTYYIDRYGEQNAQGFYDSLEGRWARNDFAEIPIGLPADAYEGVDYGAIVYGRGPIFLNVLAGEMGQETFDTFMRDYVETYRWQIATSTDFQALAEEHCNCNLSALFNEWVYGQ